MCGPSRNWWMRFVLDFTVEWRCLFSWKINSCKSQWSLYVPHSGHYMYRAVVTICTAQWSLYVPHSGHYTYRQFNTHNSTFCPHTVFMCFVWISEQTAIISLYNINWLVFIIETESVYCAVRTGSWSTSIIQVAFSPQNISTDLHAEEALCATGRQLDTTLY